MKNADSEIGRQDYDEEYYIPHAMSYEAADGWASNRLRSVFAVIQPTAADSVLDLGCGIGTFSFEIQKRGARAIGADFSGAALMTAKLLSTKYHIFPPFVQADSVVLPFKDRVFSMVLMVDFVEHLYRPQYAQTVLEVDRVLLPRGSVLIYAPNRMNLMSFPLMLRTKQWLDRIGVTDHLRKIPSHSTSPDSPYCIVPQSLQEQASQKYEKVHVDVKSVFRMVFPFLSKGYRIRHLGTDSNCRIPCLSFFLPVHWIILLEKKGA